MKFIAILFQIVRFLIIFFLSSLKRIFFFLLDFLNVLLKIEKQKWHWVIEKTILILNISHEICLKKTFKCSKKMKIYTIYFVFSFNVFDGIRVKWSFFSFLSVYFCPLCVCIFIILIDFFYWCFQDFLYTCNCCNL